MANNGSRVFKNAAEALNGRAVSYTELASITGRNRKYIVNNAKDLSLKYGLNFDCNASNEVVLKEELTQEGFKKLVNTYLLCTGHPCFYVDAGNYGLSYATPEQMLTLIRNSPSIIDSIMKSGDSDDVSILHYILNHKPLKATRVSSSARAEVLAAFNSLYPFNPSKEQEVAVVRGVNVLVGSKNHYSRATIQSVAGSSKSTCIGAIRKIIKDRGLQVPTLIAKTHKALGKSADAKTVAKFIGDKIGSRVVGVPAAKLLPIVELAVNTDPSIIEDTLIVDEYSMLTEIELSLIKMLAKRILFVGDILQLSSITIYPAPVICTLRTQYRFLSSRTSLQVAITEAVYYKDKTKMRSLIEENIHHTFTAVLDYVGDSCSFDLKTKTFYLDSFEPLADYLDLFSGDEHQVVAYSAEACREINKVMNGGADEFKVGSKIMVVRTELDKALISGSQFRVNNIDEDTGVMTCINIDTLEVRYFPKDAKYLELGYAMTTQRAQGSEWASVLAVVDTAYSGASMSDPYVSITRAATDVQIIVRATVNKDYVESLHTYTNAKEGNRNNALYNAILKEHAVTVKGLGSDEVERTVQSASNKHQDFVLNSVPQELTSNYAVVSSKGVILNGGPIEGSRFTESEAKAQVVTKRGYFIAKNLHKGNEVVLDCDSPEMVAQFEDLISQTEAWVSEDRSKAHIVFKTDKWIPSRRKHEGVIQLDLLGNTRSQMRYLKPNKHHNGLSPMMLTDEVLNRIHSSIDE